MSGKVSELKPLSSPFYAPPYTPDWHCKGFRRISVICEVDKSIIDKLLFNTPFEGTGSRIEFFVDDMSGHSLGSFNESGILVPVSYKGVSGLFHPVIFITTDVSMIAGREVFGYPKLLGEVSFEEDKGKYTGITTRNGEQLVKIELKPEINQIDPKKLISLSDNWNSDEYEWTHHLLLKSIPSPFEDRPDILRVIYRNLSATLTCIQTGKGTIEIGTANEVALTIGARVIASYYLEGDFGAGYDEDRKILDTLD